MELPVWRKVKHIRRAWESCFCSPSCPPSDSPRKLMMGSPTQRGWDKTACTSILSFLSSHRFISFPTKHFKFSCGYDPWPQTLSQNPFNPPCSLWGIDKAKRIQWQIVSGVSLIPWQFISSALTPCLWGSVPLNQQRHWVYVNKLHVIPKRFPSLGELVKHSFADTHTSFTPRIKTLAYLTHLLLSSSDIDKVDAWQLAVWEGFGWG